MKHVPTGQIRPKDRFCFVNPERGLEYRDREFEVVKYGPEVTEIRDTKTRELKSFYNVHLYATFEQRRRSYHQRIDDARAIGRNIRKRS